LRQPSLVDVRIQGDVTGIAQYFGDFPDGESIAQQLPDPLDVLIELAFLQGALGLSKRLAKCLFR
jgi:hypothetical protein